MSGEGPTDSADRPSGATGWTGGQVSLVRVLVAAAALPYAAPCDPILRCCAVVVLSIALALGWHWRIASLALLGLIVAGREVGTVGLHGPLLLFAFLPGVPYGSLAARGRPDPGGGFSLGRPFLLVARLFLVLSGVLLVTGHLEMDVGLLALALFACDPAWIEGAPAAGEERLFYDGECGLCHRFVRFLLAEDRHGALRLAPLQGVTLAETLDATARAALPDSLVLLTADRRVLVRTDAVVHAMARLGGLWRVLGGALRVVPRPLRDAVYDGVARVRKRIFPAPDALCPVVPRELGERFDP